MENLDRVNSTNGDPTKPANTVFIVDDHDGVRTSLGILLDSAGYRPVTFSSALDFLDQYDPVRPGCLLLDMRMP
ncbi:MAG: response regulator, partial [Gammaproteobacteria bacterium]